MRVVCPFTRSEDDGVERGLHPLCERALAEFAPDAEMFYLGNHVHAYRGLLERLWSDGDGFLIVEHDVEIHGSVVSELEACPEPWCAFAYRIGSTEDGFIDKGLGCTRFSSWLLEAEPCLIEQLPCRDWRRLDCELHPRLLQRGYEVHVHAPPVLHHHVYPFHGGGEWCACGTNCEEAV